MIQIQVKIYKGAFMKRISLFMVAISFLFNQCSEKGMNEKEVGSNSYQLNVIKSETNQSEPTIAGDSNVIKPVPENTIFKLAHDNKTFPGEYSKQAIENGLFNQDIMFVENKGQLKNQSKVNLNLGEIRFGTMAHGATALFGEKGIYFAFRKSQLNSVSENKERRFAKGDGDLIEYNIKFENANYPVRVSGENQLITKINYLIGNDPNKHYTDLSTFKGVIYNNLYPNIDLKYYGNNKMLKYDFIVRPEGNVQDIQLFYATDSINVNKRGELEIVTSWGNIVEEKPYAYQNIDGRIKNVKIEYALIKGKRNRIGFQIIGSYDKSHELIIDPATVTLQWSTFLGSTSPSEDGYLYDLDVDNSNNIYAAGWYSAVYPTTAGAYMTTSPGGVDAFVVKLNSTGTSIIWATYLGGGGVDRAWGIRVNKTTNEVFVTGEAENTPPAYPTTAGAYQTTHGGSAYDVFVTKLNSTGSSLVYSTFIGGSGNDEGRGIDIDASGNAYITGYTGSTNYKLAGAIQGTVGGGNDAFVSKLNSTGTGMIYSTYLGGGQDEQGWDIAVNSSGQAFITGHTSTPQTDAKPFPLVSAYQSTYGGGPKDAFLTKVNAAGSAYVYSTYLGGGNIDEGHSVVFNSSDEAFVAGTTYGSGFPLVGNLQSFGGGGDGFVTRFNSSGSSILFSTPYGGTNDDKGLSLAISPKNQVVLKGSAMSSDLTTTSDGYQTTKPANSGNLNDLFIAVYDNSSGPYTLAYATYFGGSDNDYDDLGAASFAIDNQGCFIIGATSHSLNWPTTAGVYQTTKNTANNTTPDQPVVFKMCSTILPVTFTNFTADLLGQSVLLNWTTASEKNNSYFEVQKSIDGVNFHNLGKVNGNGNSSSLSNYSFTDDEISSGILYYRLLQVDFDGNYSYSNIQTVTADKKSSVNLFPNPSSGVVTLKNYFKEEGDLEVVIIDALGQVVFNKLYHSNKGTFEQILNLDGLSSGMYTVHCYDGNENTIEKLILK